MKVIKHTFYIGNVLDVLRLLPNENVQCVVTSPPYWGLRDYGVDGQLGLESNPDCLGWATGNLCGECYVCKMVQVFREVKRVLRKDGTLWLNLGDSYVGGAKKINEGSKQKTNKGARWEGKDYIATLKCKVPGLKTKDLCGIPWRVAFALQADGWWLRSDIIFAKKNPMPESSKDRPSRAFEYVFLLAKSKRYFYDWYAVQEPLAEATVKRSASPFYPDHPKAKEWRRTGQGSGARDAQTFNTEVYAKIAEGKKTMRNMRNVWWIATEPFPEAHFAVMPTKLVEPCIKAGTSEYGCCPKCGAPWERVVEKRRYARNELDKNDPRYRPNRYKGAYTDINGKGDAGYTEAKTLGWCPTCSCGIEETVPCVVLDPFGGAGTTNLVAARLGRSSIYIDLNPQYVDMAVKRLGNPSNLFERHEIKVVNACQLRPAGSGRCITEKRGVAECRQMRQVD